MSDDYCLGMLLHEFLAGQAPVGNDGAAWKDTRLPQPSERGCESEKFLNCEPRRQTSCSQEQRVSSPSAAKYSSKFPYPRIDGETGKLVDITA